MIVTEFGVAVIEGDTHISKWVCDSRSLRIAERMLAPFRRYVRRGTSIVDAGAMIGDHTLIYSEWTHGPEAKVYAFEPNPDAFACLTYNMRAIRHVQCYQKALSNRNHCTSLNLDPNAGASHLTGPSETVGPVEAIKLDSLALPEISFMKIDVEGYEPYLLEGAQETIMKYRPVILSEVNHVALERAGTSAADLLNWLRRLKYTFRIIQKGLTLDAPQCDILCMPER